MKMDVEPMKVVRWLWPGINHWMGKMLAYVLAAYEDAA